MIHPITAFILGTCFGVFLVSALLILFPERKDVEDMEDSLK